MTILIQSISAFLLDPEFIKTEQQLITMFDCDFYNTMNDIEFPIKDMHVNINVNQNNHAIYINIKGEHDDMNQNYLDANDYTLDGNESVSHADTNLQHINAVTTDGTISTPQYMNENAGDQFGQ